MWVGEVAWVLDISRNSRHRNSGFGDGLTSKVSRRTQTVTVPLQAMYRAIGQVRCLNLVRLRGDGGVSLQDDGTTVLHLEPLGLPLGLTGSQAVESEGSLRDAVRGVLTALVVLHDAGARCLRMSPVRSGGIQE